jgi:hypothetical protein
MKRFGGGWDLRRNRRNREVLSREKGERRGEVVVSVRGKRGCLALYSRRPPFQGPTAAIGNRQVI